MKDGSSLLHSNSSVPVPILSHVNPVHVSPHWFTIIFNSMFPSTPVFSECPLSFRFVHKSLRVSLFSRSRDTCSSCLTPLDFISRIILLRNTDDDVPQIRSLPHSPFTLSLLGPNINPFLEFSQLLFLPHCDRPSFKPM